MGRHRQGSSKRALGPWSLAVAAALAPVVDAREGKRQRFGVETGIAGSRVSGLLNGEKSWYLEDVEVACRVLGLNMVDFLGSLDVPDPIP